MGNLVFQATLGGQVNLVGPNTASTFNINVPTVNGNMVTTGDTGTVTNTMCATSVYTAPGTIGSGTPNTGAFTTLSASGVATISAGSASAPALTTSGDTNTGMLFPAADTIALTTGGTERLRLDSSGNLGLGVTPSAWGGGKKVLQASNASFAGQSDRFEIWANAYYDGSAVKYISNGYATLYQSVNGAHSWQTAASGTAGGTVTLTQAMTLDASGNLNIGTTTSHNPTGYTRFANLRGTDAALYIGNDTASSAMQLSWTTSGGYVGTLSGLPLVLLTNGTERARIDSSGNLLVGTTSNANSTRLTVKGGNGLQFTLDNDGSQYTQMYFANNGTNKAYMWWDQTNTRFQIQAGGSGGVYLANNGTSWTSASDERVKDIIEPIENATEKLSNWRTVIGKYKTDEEGTRRSFLIAQDVLQTFPEAVDTTNADEFGLSYQDTIPLLVAAIKEQQAVINAQQAALESLTARITALEA